MEAYMCPRILLVLLATSCGVEQPAPAAPPPPLAILTVPDYVVAGDPLTLSVDGLTGRVWFVASYSMGGVPWCPTPAVCLDVDTPGAVLGQAVARQGRADLTIYTPAGLSAGLGHIQAANAIGERSNVVTVRVLSRGGDADRDDLPNADEAAWHTDPLRADSDGGGEADGAEVARHGDPTDAVDDLPSTACGGTYDALLGRLVCVPGGTFTMGCVQGRDTPGCLFDESPPRTVTVTRDLWVMETEIIQAQWLQLMHGQGPLHIGADLPMDNVRWVDVVAFADAVSRSQGLTPCGLGPSIGCDGWRLPTEAEWEWISRGGEAFAYPGAPTSAEVAWTAGNATETQIPCQLGRNGFGLCDMGGNVWEWVYDWYQPDGYQLDYANLDTVDPIGPAMGTRRSLRGGGFTSPATQARSAQRWAKDPAQSTADVGARLVRTVAP